MESKPKKTNKKQLISTAITVAVSVLAVNLTTQSFQKCSGNISQKQLVAEIKEFNKTLPLAVDDFNTLLDSVTISSDSILVYHATCDILEEEANLDTIKKYIDPSLLDNIKKNPDLKAYRNNQLTWKYVYNDINGNIFHTYTITPAMYK